MATFKKAGILKFTIKPLSIETWDVNINHHGNGD